MPTPDQSSDTETIKASSTQQIEFKPLKVLAETTGDKEGAWANRLVGWERTSNMDRNILSERGMKYKVTNVDREELGQWLRWETTKRERVVSVEADGMVKVATTIIEGKGKEDVGYKDRTSFMSMELKVLPSNLVLDNPGSVFITMRKNETPLEWNKEEIVIIVLDKDGKEPGKISGRLKYGKSAGTVPMSQIPRAEVKRLLQERFGLSVADLAKYPIDWQKTLIHIAETELDPGDNLTNLLDIDESDGDGFRFNLNCKEAADLRARIEEREREYRLAAAKAKRQEQLMKPLVDDDFLEKIQTPATKIYPPGKIDGDYELFLSAREDYKFDPNLTTRAKQQALFALYVAGEVDDPIQAYEWLLGGKWDEWTDEQKKFVADRLSEQEKAKYGHLLGVSSFNPGLAKLETRVF